MLALQTFVNIPGLMTNEHKMSRDIDAQLY